jgi:hypothetical protein
VGEGDVFERPVDRRELLKKVAVYTPPLLLGGAALLNAGTAFGASETSTVSECSATSLSTSSGAGSGSCYQPPLPVLEADLASLIAIPATGNPNEDKKIAQAVGYLTEATQSARWVDQFTLDPSTGDATFYDLKWAADVLHSSQNPSASTILSDVVVSAGTIANVAFDNASSLPAKTTKQVQRKLTEAGSRSASGDARGAISTYMHVWELVVLGTVSAESDD